MQVYVRTTRPIMPFRFVSCVRLNQDGGGVVVGLLGLAAGQEEQPRVLGSHAAYYLCAFGTHRTSDPVLQIIKASKS